MRLPHFVGRRAPFAPLGIVFANVAAAIASAGSREIGIVIKFRPIVGGRLAK
jgi:hypothetical protein